MLQVFVPDWSFVFKLQILRSGKVQFHKRSKNITLPIARP